MKTTLSCCFAVLALNCASAAFADESPVRVKVGHSIVLDVKDAERAAAGDAETADVKLIDEKQVLVVGLKEGKTELKVSTKKATLTFPIVVISQSAEDASPGAVKVLAVKVGASLSLPTKGIARIAVGDPDFADIDVSNAVLSIKGVKAGSTTLIIWFENGTREVSEVRVTP